MTFPRRTFLHLTAGAAALPAVSRVAWAQTYPAQTTIDEGESPMALYEMRTYTLYVGKMAEATKLYQELGFPALKKGGHDKKLLGYFQADTARSTNL